MAQALGDGSQFGVKILWSHEGEGLETAGGIINALPLVMSLSFWSMAMSGRLWTLPLLNVELGENLAHLVLVQNPNSIQTVISHLLTARLIPLISRSVVKI